MKKEKLEVVRGSGNVFRDFGTPDADARQLKAILAAEILKRLDREGLRSSKAQALAGMEAGDLSSIRNVELARLTVDRLITIANRVGARVDAAAKFPRKA